MIRPNSLTTVTFAMKIAVIVAIFSILSAVSANAGDQLPLLPGGVVFPEYNNLGRGNPGTLSKFETSLARALFMPAAFGSTTEALDLDYTITRPNWGFDIGYNGSRSNYGGYQSPISHLVHAGAGYRLDSLGFGLAYTFPVASDYATQNLELGLAYDYKKMRLALVLEHLEGSPQATLGFGTHESDYAIELNLQLPGFAQGFTNSGSTYTLSLAAEIYMEDFGIGYITSHPFVIPSDGQPGVFETPFTLEHTFSVLYKFTKTGTVSVRFDPANTLTFGVTISP